MHILIAGGAGFVGSNLALAFRGKYPAYEITCLDNLCRKGSALNVPRLQAAGIRFRQADTRYPEQLVTEQPIDCIIDAAAEPSVLAGLQGGINDLVNTNFNGTVHLLELARTHKAGFIFLSTSRVYPIAQLEQLRIAEEATRFTLTDHQSLAGCSSLGIREDFPLQGSRSLYGATKLASELMVEEYRVSFGVPAIINRCGVIAGPWQMGKVDQGVIALWLARHYWQIPLQYIGFGGTGKQVRDVLHVADLFDLLDYQVHHTMQLNGTLFNVGGGLSNSLSLQELTKACRQMTGKTVSVTASNEARPGDIPLYITDNSKVTAMTGWRPTRSLDQLLQDTYHWLLENEKTLQPIFHPHPHP